MERTPNDGRRLRAEGSREALAKPYNNKRKVSGQQVAVTIASTNCWEDLVANTLTLALGMGYSHVCVRNLRG